MQEDSAVREALKKGIWREKKDPKTGRVYYVNVRTRVSVWNLAKELAKSAPQTLVNTAHGLADERREQAKRWQEEEAGLMQHITDLEREKVQLESEISLLQGPTEAEAAALQGERNRLIELKQSLENVVAEDLRLRQEKTTELQQLQASLETLRLERQHELEMFEALKKQLVHLQQEYEAALADLQREEVAMDSLQDEYRQKKQQLDDALREEARLKEFLEMRGSEMDRMKAELKLVCQRKAELQRHHESLAAELALEKMFVDGDTAPKGADASSSLLLSRLQSEVVQRRKTLQRLEQQQRLAEAVELIEVESTELRHLTALAEREARRLTHFSRELGDQVRAVTPLVEAMERDVQQLVEELEA